MICQIHFQMQDSHSNQIESFSHLWPLNSPWTFSNQINCFKFGYREQNSNLDPVERDFLGDKVVLRMLFLGESLEISESSFSSELFRKLVPEIFYFNHNHASNCTDNHTNLRVLVEDFFVWHWCCSPLIHVPDL